MSLDSIFISLHLNPLIFFLFLFYTAFCFPTVLNHSETENISSQNITGREGNKCYSRVFEKSQVFAEKEKITHIHRVRDS